MTENSVDKQTDTLCFSVLLFPSTPAKTNRPEFVLPFPVFLLTFESGKTQFILHVWVSRFQG